MAEAPLGVVLAGGESSRYGSPKALATVGGRRIVDRVVAALREVTDHVAISANEPELFSDLAFPTFPDEQPGLGPLGGILAGLRRAEREGRPGILAVACDLPFPSVELLALLRDRAFGNGAASGPEDTGDSGSGWGSGSEQNVRPPADPTPSPTPTTERPPPAAVVTPASRSRRGLEPLFAAYAVACIPAIEEALADGDRRVIGFHERVSVHTIPLEVVESLCDPDVAFMNVNAPGDRERAEKLAAEAAGGG